MKIERLEISGFKSFPDPVSLRFDPGTTGVVGPNGCGKSNIADAIVWVLGELGAGHLRARGAEVIFSGSEARPSLGLAEVKLHVSGVAADSLPGARRGSPGGNGAGASEATGPVAVVVGRRVDRTGQSAYSIDGRRCARRDVLRLFAGTGFGPSSWALIEQGRMGDVLAKKPPELRAVVEEAAGLGRYRLDRRDTELSLRAAERSLVRVGDRIAELDRRIREARREARAAARARRKTEEVRLLALAERWARRRDLLERTRLRRAPMRGLEAEASRRATSVQVFERWIEEQRRRRSRLEDERRAAAERIGALRARQGRADAVLAEGARVAEERESRRVRLDAEERGIRARLSARADEAKRSAAAREGLPARIAELGAQATARATARDRARLEADRQADELDGTKRRMRELEVRAGAARIRAEENRRRADEIGRGRASLAESEAALRSQLAGVESRAAGTERELAERSGEEARRAEALDAAQKAVAEAGARFASERDGEARARRSRDEARARLGSLEALLVSREQLGRSTRMVLEAAEREERKLPVLGAVGEDLEVAAGYERAAERLVGLHRIRVKRVGDVAEIAGAVGPLPCEFLVSELAEALPEGGAEPRGTEDPAADRLRERVRSGDPAVRASVPDAVVVADLDEAVRAFRAAPGVYVTRDGETVRPPGTVRLGQGGEGDGYLSTRREVREMQASVQALDADLEERTGALAGARAGLEEAEAGRDRARSALDEVRGALARLRAVAETSSEARAAVVRQLEGLEAQRAALDEDERRGEETSKSSAAELEAAESGMRGLEAAAEAQESALEQARQVLAAAGSAFEEADRQLAREQGIAHQIERESRVQAGEAAGDEARLESIAAERESLAAAGRDWEERREAAEAERAAAASGTAEREAAAEALAGDAAGMERRLRDGVEALGERREELLSLERRVSEDAREAAEAESRLRELEDDFRRRHHADIEQAAAALPDALRDRPHEELAARSDEAGSALAAFGPVDETAEARLKALREERETPAAALRDVEQGIVEGRRALERHDRDARRSFRAAFGEVNDRFGAAFRQLFGGGRAELRLIEPDEDPEEAKAAGEEGADAGGGAGAVRDVPAVLRAGVEIVAQPPGKRLRNVRLLSGGEKALTGIAFLLALFRFRPAPFCLLDEADAPLDDENVRRFLAMLGELRRDTQLVVITHNRQTMEACSHLYGVTMEEKGVSRVVSAPLDEEPEDVAEADDEDDEDLGPPFSPPGDVGEGEPDRALRLVGSR